MNRDDEEEDNEDDEDDDEATVPYEDKYNEVIGDDEVKSCNKTNVKLSKKLQTLRQIPQVMHFRIPF